MPENPRWFSPPLYGLKTYGDLFTPRQLMALTTFSDLAQEAREQVEHDALAAGLSNNGKPLRDGGVGAKAYAEALEVYLAFAVDKMLDLNCSLVRWDNVDARLRGLFGRQAIPMVWDFAENNPFSHFGARGVGADQSDA